MSGEVLSQQNRSGGQNSETGKANGQNSINSQDVENTEGSEWTRLFQGASTATKGGGNGTGKVADSVQIGSMLKGVSVDGSAGRGAIAGGGQDMPSIQLKNVSRPAPTAGSQPTGYTLPEGVDEMAILRQISDGLKLRPGQNQTATIQLNPAELGQVQVKVQVEGATARIMVNTEPVSYTHLTLPTIYSV